MTEKRRSRLYIRFNDLLFLYSWHSSQARYAAPPLILLWHVGHNLLNRVSLVKIKRIIVVNALKKNRIRNYCHKNDLIFKWGETSFRIGYMKYTLHNFSHFPFLSREFSAKRKSENIEHVFLYV